MPAVQLIDNHNLKPRQRQLAKQILSSLPESERAWLIPLFDHAFELQLDHRVQSARQLLNFLNRRNVPPSDAEATRGKLASVRAALQSESDLMDRVNAQNLLQSIMKNFDQAVANVRKELGDNWGSSQSGHGLNMASLTIGNELGLFHPMYPERRFCHLVEGRIDGKELIATASHDGQKVELMRASLTGPKDWIGLRAKIEETFADGLQKLFRQS